MLPILPRKLWLLVCAFGVILAVVFALIPVSTDFGDDPLLRLRQLDPVLSPPDTTALCGSPVRAFDLKSDGATFYERARDNACRAAAQRRLLAAGAGGAILVMVGLLGLAARNPDLRAGVGYPLAEGDVGRQRPERNRARRRQAPRRPGRGQQVVR